MQPVKTSLLPPPRKRARNEGDALVMSDAQVEEAARLFALLAEPARLFLLRALMTGGRLNVGQLVAATGLKQANVSKHLGILASVGFVSRQQEGNFAHYEIADPSVPSLCELMCSRIQREARHRVPSVPEPSAGRKPMR